MKLYSTDGATAVDDPDLGIFTADEQGAVDVPIELYERLHGIHLDGKRLWESESERYDRLAAEDLARRKDPATLLAAVESLSAPQLTAEQLREAEEERKRIKAEREIEAEQDRLKAEQRAQQERIDAEKAQAAADAERVAKEAEDAQRLADAQQADAERIAEERGIKIDETVHVADSTIEGIVTEILSVDGVPSARVDAGEVGGVYALDVLVLGPVPSDANAESSTEPDTGEKPADVATPAAPAAEPAPAEPKAAKPSSKPASKPASK